MSGFSFSTKDGSRTIAATASIALLHWYMRFFHKPELVEGSVLQLIPINEPCSGPYEPNFLINVIEHIRKNYGISVVGPESEMGSIMSALILDFDYFFDEVPKDVALALLQGDPKVVRYEKYCVGLLRLLAKHDIIFDLICDGVDDDYQA